MVAVLVGLAVSVGLVVGVGVADMVADMVAGRVVVGGVVGLWFVVGGVVAVSVVVGLWFVVGLAVGIMGQQWAAARSRSWRVTKHPVTGEPLYELKIVYCHTDQMQYKSKENPDGECLLHGGLPSFTRCAACPDNHGMTSATSTTLPESVRRIRLR